MSGKAMAKLSDDQKQIIDAAAENHFKELIIKTRQANQESRSVLTNQGVKFVTTTEEILKTLENHRDDSIKGLVGTAFSEESYQILSQTLNQLRNQ